MNIKLLLFFIVLIGGFIFSSQGNTFKNRRNYIVFMMVILTLESCLRGLSVGSDTMNYYWYFNYAAHSTWSDVWTEFLGRYIDQTSEEDIGFLVFNKLVSVFTSNFSVYLGVCALFFFIPFGKLLSRYTSDFTQLIFIFIFYVALFNPIAMSGVRKEIALGCSVWATIAYIDKSYKSLLISLVIGSLIHLSTLSWLIVPVLQLFETKRLRLFHVVSLFLIPVVIVASGAIIVYMGNFVGMEKYAEYGMNESTGGAFTFTLLIEFLSLFCLYAYRKCSFEKGSYMHVFYGMLPCFSFFAPLITNNGSMIRISQYFHLYIILLLPFAIDKYFVHTRKTVYVLLSLLLLFITLRNDSEPYLFIWEDNNAMYVPVG